VGIDLFWSDGEHVARRLRDEESAAPRAEDLPQPGQLLVEGVHGIARRPLTPQQVDQPIGGYHLVGVDE
jgi:hypothetical protein